MADVIIPRYKDETPGFKRACDWLFGSESGFRRYIAERKRAIKAELADLARHNAETKTKNIDGLGQAVAQISLQDWMYWNAALPGCWQDKQFLREYRRDNEYCRLGRPEQRTWGFSGRGRWAKAA